MNHKIRKMLVATSLVTATIAMSGCANLVSLTTDAEAAKVAAEQISGAERVAAGQLLSSSAIQFETVYAVEGVYPTEAPEGVLFSTSDNGFLLATPIKSGGALYRSSVSPSVLFLDSPPESVTVLVEAGLKIPEGLTELPN